MSLAFNDDFVRSQQQREHLQHTIATHKIYTKVFLHYRVFTIQLLTRYSTAML